MSISFRPTARQYNATEKPVKEMEVSPVEAVNFLRFRYLSLAGVLIAVIMPMIIRQMTTGIHITFPTQYNTAIGGVLSLAIGLICYRRLHVFPGIKSGGYIFTCFTISFGILAFSLFIMRIDYSRLQFLSSYILTICFYIYVELRVSSKVKIRLGVVPSVSTEKLPFFEKIVWVPLSIDSTGGNPPVDAVVADLNSDHESAWEAEITKFVLNGIPVYHIKQVIEQISGRVEIYHLSENTLGSLNPNDVYLKIKAAFDFLIALILLFIVWPVIAFAAVLVRLDSSGPAFFKQQRTGFRGEPFTVYKIRTMRIAPAHDKMSDGQVRQAAMTASGDPRITRLGQFLRRTRLDELPQLVNILKGDMSLIGPRPEALPLTKWYESEIPFYHYRHLIKPGVTGWAQVNQGHVTDVEDVKEKLYLDFYYVKNFSIWLDILISIKTIGTMVNGHGAR